ncbi:MAG TPA: Ppx/GppA phosphatase family protein [Nocardioidaceae bacterium]|nr:Ppx/GppA phosphatase family protein [Nocardioidaceae bacterium]
MNAGDAGERVAAIDCGTNSIRLLVAEPDGAGGLRDLDRRMLIVRLGQGVDATGRFTDEALQRTFDACDDYAAVLRDLGVHRLRFCATSAARDAANGDVFAAGVEERLGVRPEVLTGDDEAALSYDGATRDLERLDVPVPYLVLDIGGGSTEFVLGDGHGHVRFAESVDIGSVRMTERHLHGDPPTAEEIEAAVADVDATLDRLRVPLEDTGTLVGVAGTITTVAAMVLDLPEYDSDRIHHARIGVDDVVTVRRRLLAMTRAQRRALGFMHPGRADVIGAGTLILDRVVQRIALGLEQPVVLVSEHDILDGIAWSLAEEALVRHRGRR